MIAHPIYARCCFTPTSIDDRRLHVAGTSGASRLVALPAIVLLGAGVLRASIAGTLLGLLALPVLYLAGHLARDAGKRIEPGLWESWGGAPTTQLLRHQGPSSPPRLQALHQAVRDKLGRQLPSEEFEVENPDAADESYEDAVVVLRARTRDQTEFPLIAAENANYGFRRNALGLRVWESRPRVSHSSPAWRCPRFIKGQ